MQLLLKRYYFITLLFLLSPSFFVLHCSHAKKSESTETIKDSLNLFYGIAGKRGTILDKKYFVINHNDAWKIPYWVAYYLTSHDLQGTTKRQSSFNPDPELPSRYEAPLGLRAELADYNHSGYDRGHMAPAADFKRSKDAMTATFVLSNMSPQISSLNRNKRLAEIFLIFFSVSLWYTHKLCLLKFFLPVLTESMPISLMTKLT